MEPEQMPGPPHGDDRSTRIGRVPGQTEQKHEPRDLSRPAFPRAAERAGVATSAMSRDGARLRTVMTRAVERNGARVPGAADDEWRADHEVAYGAPHPVHDPDASSPIPMPELSAEEPGGMPGAPAEPEGYRATRLVIPPADRASSTYAAAASADEGKDATRLRPVTSLEQFKPAPEPPAASRTGAPAQNPAPAGYEWKGPATAGRSAGAVSGDATREDVWDAAATAATPRIASDSWTGASRQRDRGTGGFRKGATAALTVVVGTAVGIALYAGGSGYLSDIFSNRNEGVEMTVSPSAVTERPQTTVPDPQAALPSAGMAADSGGAGNPDSALAARYDRYVVEDRMDAAEEENRAPKPASQKSPTASNLTEKPEARAEAPAKKSPENPRTPAVTAGDAAKAKADAQNKEKLAAKKEADAQKKETSAASTGKYIVQVRATSDESEANLIAKKLRKKGISNVQIVRSEKNGAPFFRIRFTAAGTGSEAQAKAKNAGFSDAWVVQQK